MVKNKVEAKISKKNTEKKKYRHENTEKTTSKEKRYKKCITIKMS